MTEAFDFSPFHEGEQVIQSHEGVRDQAESLGQRYIRDHLPDEYREFYQQLPMLLIGSVDDRGRPWASVLVGRKGFLQSPDRYTLSAHTPRIHGDPLNAHLEPGSQVGVLGIDYQGRRRNRLTAKVSKVDDRLLELRVDQTFGNCPQYIQAREPEFLPGIDQVGEERPQSSADRLGDRTRAIIAKADHFFIATHYSENTADVRHGADVSHRGGKPGFVRIDNEKTLTFPDYSGNNHFNTLGNITMNPLAGLLFIDFVSGDLLYLTCSAEIIFDSDEKRAFDGAERLVRFTIDEAVLVENAMPMRWDFVDYSPSLDRTGSWQEVEETLATRRSQNTLQNYTVIRVEQESEVIKSIYLEPEDGKPIHCHRAGQFLPIELDLAGQDGPLRRTYTISNAPNGAYYRLSIKREASSEPGLPSGRSSNHMHDTVTAGSTIRALPPRGQFVLEESSCRPVVLLSAGVGITPVISMLDHLAEESAGCGGSRPVFFIHGARHAGEHAFGKHVRRLARDWSALNLHVAYSAPRDSDVAGQHYDSRGRVDVALVKKLLPFDDYDFYFCGPAPFMQDLYQGLKNLNVADDRIHYEFFGPGANLRQDNPGVSEGLVGELENIEPVEVRFSRSGKTATWDPTKGTLLELAESVGVNAPYSCRSGICATCECKLEGGEIAYTEPPLAEPSEGHALICCAYPASSNEDLILDL